MTKENGSHQEWNEGSLKFVLPLLKLRTGKREKSAYPGYEPDPAAKLKTRTEKIRKHAGQ